MKVNGRAKFISAKKGTSQQGKPYFMVRFLDDENFLTLFADENTYKTFSTFEKGKDISLSLDIGNAKRGYYVQILPTGEAK